MDTTFRDFLKAYGPSLALVGIIVLLIVLLPGNFQRGTTSVRAGGEAAVTTTRAGGTGGAGAATPGAPGAPGAPTAGSPTAGGGAAPSAGQAPVAGGGGAAS